MLIASIIFGWTNPTSAPPGGSGTITLEDSGTYTGNIGIENANPIHKLDVAGTFLATSSVYLATLSGKVGINTLNPNEKLQVFDGSFTQDTPKNLISAGQIGALPDRSRGLFVAGKFAYLTYNDQNTISPNYRFEIFDVSKPSPPLSPPQSLGKILSGTGANQFSGGVRDVYVAGNYAYVTPFAVVDVSNPSSPTIVAQSSSIAGFQIHVAGKYAYVTSPINPYLKIVDISNPVAPFLVSSVTISGFPVTATAYDVFVSGRYAYLTLHNNLGGSPSNDPSHFRIIDISNPAVPSEVLGSGGLDSVLPPNVRELFVSGRYAYLAFDQPASGNNAFRIIDISDPSSPSLPVGATWPSLPEQTHKLFTAGRYVYTLSYNYDTSEAKGRPLRIIDVLNPASPQVVGGVNFSTLNAGRNIFVSGHYAYVHYSGNPLENIPSVFEIIDISGIEGVSASIHSLETGSLQVREGATVVNQLQAGGLIAGPGGILSSGNIGVGELLLGTLDDSPTLLRPGAIKLEVINGGSGVTCNSVCSGANATLSFNCTANCGVCLSAFVAGSGSNIGCGADNPAGVVCLCGRLGN